MQGESSNGAVSLSGVGDVKVTNRNGAIDLDGVVGHNIGVPTDPAGEYRLDLSTHNGAITVTSD